MPGGRSPRHQKCQATTATPSASRRLTATASVRSSRRGRDSPTWESRKLCRGEDVSAVLLGDRYFTPELLVRQHVGQQDRVVAGHGDETIARSAASTAAR